MLYLTKEPTIFPGQIFLLYIFALLVFMAFVGGSVFSVYLNAAFGASRVGELGRWIAVICDLFKIGLSGAFLYIQGGLTRILALLGMMAFGGLSILSSYGYYIEAIEQTHSQVRAEQNRYNRLTNQKQTLLKEKAQLGAPRPMKAIQLDIRAHKRDIIYTDTRRSNHCRNATIEASRNFCERLRQLEVELELAHYSHQRLNEIRSSLKTIEQDLKRINLTQVSRRVDMFARSFGNPDQSNMVFNLFLALLIEVTTIAGLPVMVSLIQAGTALQRQAKLYQSIHKKTEIGNKNSIPVQPINSLDHFLLENTIAEQKGFVTSADLRARYVAWCQVNGIAKPLHTPQIGEHMVRLGYERVRRKATKAGKRLTGYLGLAFKS